jgi:hypothetical protein
MAGQRAQQFLCRLAGVLGGKVLVEHNEPRAWNQRFNSITAPRLPLVTVETSLLARAVRVACLIVVGIVGPLAL